ncbi:MAG: sensor histidine kinase, partial [Desulfobacteraceae bacterium]
MASNVDAKVKISSNSPRGTEPVDIAATRKATYSRLFRKFVWLTLLCSVAPLLLVGWGINLHYTRFARQRMLNYFETQVDYHRKIIEMFLKEHSSKLQIIARTHTRDELARIENLHEAFNALNREMQAVTDLGLIDAHGNHLAYVGPYDLMSRNYSREPWFKEVMEKGLFISDMFMGFRKEPHFIIAVTQLKNGEKWILRTTIHTDSFRALVENVRIGRTGQVYLLNREGVFQTSPRSSGAIMEKSTFPMGPFHEGILIRTLDGLTDDQGREKPRQIACQVWLKDPRWLLVVKQDYAEAFDDVNYANTWTLVFLHVSALSILVVSILITRHMITIIKRRDAQADQLNEQVLQAGKLASIGELAAGVAHEINNPLAIILTESQLVRDVTGDYPDLNGEFKTELSDSMSQIEDQVQRCNQITHNLL